MSKRIPRTKSEPLKLDEAKPDVAESEKAKVDEPKADKAAKADDEPKSTETAKANDDEPKSTETAKANDDEASDEPKGRKKNAGKVIARLMDELGDGDGPVKIKRSGKTCKVTRRSSASSRFPCDKD